MVRFDERTARQILETMLENARDDIDKRQGSVAYDMLAPVAQEIELLGFELQAIYTQGFLDTASGEALDLHVNEVGIARKLAVSATGVVNLTGTTGTVIPAGYRFTNIAGESFASTSVQVISNSTANVPVEAVTPGLIGNIGSGEIVDHERNVVGINFVTNNVAFDGGEDAETDDSLRERALFKIRAPITSGNANNYILWATSIPGVASAKIFPTFNGPNTVKVVIVSANGGAPSAQTVTDVAEYIETQRPIGAQVTVVPIEEVPVDISVKLITEPGGNPFDTLIDLSKAINAYFTSEVRSGVVRYTRVGEAILAVKDIIDYEDLTINGGTSNIYLGEEQVGVVGMVNVR